MQKNNELRELDLWRGVAVIFMIVNHAGFAMLGPWSSQNLVEHTLIFVGSFAPVLFFFITGFGYGISLERNGPTGQQDRFDWSTWYKAGILVLMDILLRGAYLNHVGWDFLGFIALSMLILSLVRNSRSPLVVAGLLALASVGLRFVAGPLYEYLVPAAERSTLLGALLGLLPFKGISYWFAPWLVYPMAGFVAGYAFMRYRPRLLQQSWRFSARLTLVSSLFLLGSLVLYLMGMVFFRWGTVSVAYFVLSLGVLFLTAVLCWAVCILFKGERVTSVLAQRGVSSLAIVPIHYALLHYSEQLLPVPLTTAAFLVYLVLLIGISYTLARSIGELARTLMALSRSRVLVLFFALSATGMTVVLGMVELEPAIKTFYIFALEIVLCLLLPLRVVSRQRPVQTGEAEAAGSGR